MNNKPHACDLRKGRHSLANHAYLITAVTTGREPVFADIFNARVLIQALVQTEQQGYADTLAYVVMPDHLHWLCRLTGKSSLSSMVQRTKSIANRNLKRLTDLSQRTIWQRGFHDRAIRQESDLLPVSRYIVANPLRAGLCRTLSEYPHWDCIWYHP